MWDWNRERNRRSSILEIKFRLEIYITFFLVYILATKILKVPFIKYFRLFNKTFEASVLV